MLELLLLLGLYLRIAASASFAILLSVLAVLTVRAAARKGGFRGAAYAILGLSLTVGACASSYDAYEWVSWLK